MIASTPVARWTWGHENAQPEDKMPTCLRKLSIAWTVLARHELVIDITNLSLSIHEERLVRLGAAAVLDYVGIDPSRSLTPGCELDNLVASAMRIDVDGPDVDMDDAQRVLYQGQPFTGEVAEYQSGRLISLDEYANGILDGLSREWHQDGTLLSEGVVRNGRAVGAFKEWHPNGVLKSRKFFDNAVASLREEETWDEHGVLLSSWRRDEG